MGVPAQATGGDGAIRGGEGPPRYAAGGGERSGARPTRYVERDFVQYLECKVLAQGFARVRCESCKDELLVRWRQA